MDKIASKDKKFILHITLDAVNVMKYMENIIQKIILRLQITFKMQKKW